MDQTKQFKRVRVNSQSDIDNSCKKYFDQLGCIYAHQELILEDCHTAKEVHFVFSYFGDAYGEFESKEKALKKARQAVDRLVEKIKSGNHHIDLSNLQDAMDRSPELQRQVRSYCQEISSKPNRDASANEVTSVMVAQLSNGDLAVLLNGSILLTAESNDSEKFKGAIGMMAKALSNQFQVKNEIRHIQMGDLPERWEWSDVEDYLNGSYSLIAIHP